MSRTVQHLSIVIPTKDHPQEVERLLQSLHGQTVWPGEVVVVDGGANPVRGAFREPAGMPIRYVRVSPPGLARQQNAGVHAVASSATLVGFLDDDMVLGLDALERMLHFWERADHHVAGAAFNLTNNTDHPQGVWFKMLFGMDGRLPGRLLRSGYQTKIGAVPHTREVEWLYGGATVWRKTILDAYPFDEWFEGPSYLYELDFSFRVGQRYRMVVVAEAHAKEVAAPTRQWVDRPLGMWQVLNRLYFVTKHEATGRMSSARCRLALFCQFLVNLGRGTIGGEPRYLSRAIGNVDGWRRARSLTASRDSGQAPVRLAKATNAPS